MPTNAFSNPVKIFLHDLKMVVSSIYTVCIREFPCRGSILGDNKVQIWKILPTSKTWIFFVWVDIDLKFSTSVRI